MVFETKRLILRPWEDADAAALYPLAKDPRVGPVAGWPAHTSVEDSRRVIREVLSAPETYAIVRKENGLPIGSIGLFPTSVGRGHDGEWELGYWVGAPYWGRGFCPEAAERLLRHAFEDLGAERVWCAYYEGNEKSKRVQEKLGFQFQWINEQAAVPQLGETRKDYVNLLTKETWLGNTKARQAALTDFNAKLAAAEREIVNGAEGEDFLAVAKELRGQVHRQL